MAWLEVQQSLATHWKVAEAAKLVGRNRPTIVGHLVLLWLWALDNAPDGRLPTDGLPAEEMAGWRGQPGRLLQGLLGAGLLDRADDGSYEIHNWHIYTGRLLTKRAANRERMRSSRAEHVQRTKETRAATVQEHRTVPYSTNRTEQNRTVEDGALLDAKPPTPPTEEIPEELDYVSAEATDGKPKWLLMLESKFMVVKTLKAKSKREMLNSTTRTLSVLPDLDVDRSAHKFYLHYDGRLKRPVSAWDNWMEQETKFAKNGKGDANGIAWDDSQKFADEKLRTERQRIAAAAEREAFRQSVTGREPMP